jgi:hypothetical protein
MQGPGAAVPNSGASLTPFLLLPPQDSGAANARGRAGMDSVEVAS